MNVTNMNYQILQKLAQRICVIWNYYFKMDKKIKMYTVQWWIQQGSGGSDPHTPPPPNLECSMYMLMTFRTAEN
jgi:hypothetical protein